MGTFWPVTLASNGLTVAAIQRAYSESESIMRSRQLPGSSAPMPSPSRYTIRTSPWGVCWRQTYYRVTPITARLATHWPSRKPDISAKAAFRASVFPEGIGVMYIFVGITTPTVCEHLGPQVPDWVPFGVCRIWLPANQDAADVGRASRIRVARWEILLRFPWQATDWPSLLRRQPLCILSYWDT